MFAGRVGWTEDRAAHHPRGSVQRFPLLAVLYEYRWRVWPSRFESFLRLTAPQAFFFAVNRPAFLEWLLDWTGESWLKRIPFLQISSFPDYPRRMPFPPRHRRNIWRSLS